MRTESMSTEFLMKKRPCAARLTLAHMLKTAVLVGLSVLFTGSLFLAAAADKPARAFKLTAESPAFWKLLDRKAKLTKVAGFEWGTGFYICPTPPEESARFIREAQVMPVASR